MFVFSFFIDKITYPTPLPQSTVFLLFQILSTITFTSPWCPELTCGSHTKSPMQKAQLLARLSFRAGNQWAVTRLKNKSSRLYNLVHFLPYWGYMRRKLMSCEKSFENVTFCNFFFFSHRDDELLIVAEQPNLFNMSAKPKRTRKSRNKTTADRGRKKWRRIPEKREIGII